MSKFGIGDRVKVVKAHNDAGQGYIKDYKNLEGEVTEISDDDYAPVTVKFVSKKGTFYEDELELVTETKFKVGDRVRVLDDAFQDFARGEVFTVTGVVNEGGPRGSQAYYTGDKTASGIWEANLELAPAEKTLKDKLADARELVADLERQIKEAQKTSLANLPNGSLIDTGSYVYVKTGPNQWRPIVDSKYRRDVPGMLHKGPYTDAEFKNPKVLREGI